MRETRVPAVGRTASPSTARAINDRLALQLLQSEGPLTATQLKTLTGLSRPTVADLVERLREAGLIEVVGEAGARRRGPNARLYGIVAERAHLVGVDLRDHAVTVAVADLLGRVLAEDTVALGDGGGDGSGAGLVGGDGPDVGGAFSDGVDSDVRDEFGAGVGPDMRGAFRDGSDPAVRTVIAALDRTLAKAGAERPHAVAVGAPGLVDPATGRLGGTGWVPGWHATLIGALGDHLSVPVLLENEVNLAAIAEQRDGAARDRDTFVLLWLGHGTGAAVVLDGALRRGASGGTGEIGFLPVPGTGGLPTPGGCDGGFHSLAGGAAVQALAERHGVRVPAGASADAYAPPGEAAVRTAVTGPAGSPEDAFLDALAARVAIGVAAVSAVLDPGCVVLGGEIGHAGGDVLAGRVAEHLARISPLRTEVRAGTVGGRAVLRGAVVAAREAVQAELFGALPEAAVSGPSGPHR
ncbi:ROK family transcriptional regulator [Streptomyces sp. NPDC003077]|uniref:ROK family transcriptional regulator n=1 Tax=Streptomyces sp. NPDC003077 TaxID=3154443 RepID=UPI0033BB2937